MRCLWSNQMRNKEQLVPTSLYPQQKQKCGSPWAQALGSSLSEPHGAQLSRKGTQTVPTFPTPCWPAEQNPGARWDREGWIPCPASVSLLAGSLKISVSCSLQSSYLSWSLKKCCVTAGSDETSSPAIADLCVQQKGRNVAKGKQRGDLRARPALATAWRGLKGSGHSPVFNHPQVPLHADLTQALFPNSSQTPLALHSPALSHAAEGAEAGICLTKESNTAKLWVTAPLAATKAWTLPAPLTKCPFVHLHIHSFPALRGIQFSPDSFCKASGYSWVKTRRQYFIKMYAYFHVLSPFVMHVLSSPAPQLIFTRVSPG